MADGIRLRVLPAALPSNVELSTNDTHVIWRLTGGEWAELFEIPTFAIGTVTTLAAGEEATVENVGEGNAIVLNFGIPRGDQGVVESIQVGDGLTIDNTDPANPIIDLAE